ncbi:Transporter [Petrocella atlantisensis]|uniref:Transporter n=1 Tax=Petrocella atlantisensis TaxID=2173034 RepID=A0A3P7S2M6_9FIRM|nr:YeeE/YedE thiosulfate transporter family protein [Petrocella atlantisensis]VDN49086.1 Transporter [Petrocella atlantisensis]
MGDTEKTETVTGRSARGSSRRKPKKSQLPYAIVLIVLVGALSWFLDQRDNGTFWLLLTGLAFGYILQRSRFCFTASMRDPYLTGSTTVTRAVLVAFAITTIGFTAIKYGYFINGLPIPGMSYVVPISFATIAGAILFGIGMVIAGGCASGTLMRFGEGFQMQFLSLIFFIFGSLWGAHDFGWWKYHFISKGKAIFLPDYFGWLGAVVLQLIIIFLLYVAAEKYQEAKSNH